MKFRTLIPSLFLLLAASFSSLNGGVLLELNFPYASKWTNPVTKGLGNGLNDLDLDGVKNDAARGLKASTPTDPEYLGMGNFTNPGPEIMMRGVLAHMDAPSAVPPRVSSHGITKGSIRLEGTRKDPSLTNRMSYVGWWYIPRESFNDGGVGADFAKGGTVQASAAGNSMGIQWRVMVKNAGKYYLSDVVSTGGSLFVDDLASASWSLYRHAEGGLSMRFNEGMSEFKLGAELNQVEGLGIYAELIGFDGTMMGEKQRVLLDVQEFTVTLN